MSEDKLKEFPIEYARWEEKASEHASTKEAFEALVAGLEPAFASYTLKVGREEKVEPGIKEKLKSMRPDLQAGTPEYEKVYEACLSIVMRDVIESIEVERKNLTKKDFEFREVCESAVFRLNIPPA